MRIIRNLYSQQYAVVRGHEDVQVKIKKGVRQGCILSPTLYNIYADEAMKNMDASIGIKLADVCVNRIMYTDDMVLLADTEQDLASLIRQVTVLGQEYDINLNIAKTKCMHIAKNPSGSMDMASVTGPIEEVSKFNYLGVCISNDGTVEPEINRRIAIAKDAFWKNNKICRSDIRIGTKKRMISAMVWSVLKYGSELWPITKRIAKRIEALEMWTYRRSLKISWTSKVTNEEVLRKMQLTEPVLLRQMRYFGHVIRGSSGAELAQFVKAEATQTKLGRGRKRTKWYSAILKATESGSMQQMISKAESRDEWRTIVNRANLHW